MNASEDKRFMGATIRYARRNIGLTGTNPSVGTLIVRHEKEGPIIIGRGVTAIGGRPHAEPLALLEAGDQARGATAYVTLEPCAHHGATPPCARSLVDAGIARVVTGWIDPDHRVDGKGHAMLRKAGIEVVAGLLEDQAREGLEGYLTRKQKNRPYVTVKLALSQDNMIGISGHGQVSITGRIARAQVHMMRAASDAILVGAATARADDPELTCRLPGLENRSPHRFILDSKATLLLESRLVKTIPTAPLSIVSSSEATAENITRLQQKGAKIVPGEMVNGRVALPELLEDMAGTGISTLFVEGGANTVEGFLDAGLVDEIALFTGNVTLGENGIPSPITRDNLPKGFTLARQEKFGDDQLHVYQAERK